jgi:fibronectin-binding autotransporter adhesin
MKNKNRLILSSLITIALASGTAQAAVGTWTSSGAWNGTSYDLWDTTATNWSGVSGTPWDITNGPTNIANIGTNVTVNGTVYTNGINFTGSLVVGQGEITLAGTTPFIGVVSSSNVWVDTNISGTSGLTKLGAGILTLQGFSKSLTGGLTAKEGILQLRLGEVSTSIINPSNALTLNGGTLDINALIAASTQTLASVTLSGGSSVISLTGATGTNTSLTLGNTWTRNQGGTLVIDLSSAGGTKTVTSSPTLTNGILGYALVKDSTGTGFATVSGGNIVRYTAGTVITGSLSTDTVSTTNYVTGVGATLGGASVIQNLNSLEITGTNNLTNDSKTMVLGSGGFILNNSGGVMYASFGSKWTSSTGTFTLHHSGGDYSWLNGSITDNGGTSVSFVKSGTGTVRSLGSSTYTGDTIINQGNLRGLIPNGAGKGNLVINSAGNYNWGFSAAAITLTVNGLSNTTVSGGTINNIGYGGTDQSIAVLNVGNNNATAAFSGVMSFGSIIKNGTGTQTLSGTNTYGGFTRINSGILRIDTEGSISNTSGVQIAGGQLMYGSSNALSKPITFTSTGGTLTGTGSIVNAFTVTSGNTYTPGAKGGTGTQTLTGGITFNAGSIFDWDITTNGTTETGRDQVINTGGLSGSGAIFNVVLGTGSYADTFWNTSKTWSDAFSVGTMANVFSSITGTGVTWDSANNRGVVNLEGAFSMTGNSLLWTPVPEPTSALAGLLLGAGLLRRRRSN